MLNGQSGGTSNSDQGMGVQISGPGGLTKATGQAPGVSTTAAQGIASITQPALSTGSVTAYVNTVAGAQYQIQVSNYNAGFSANYTMTVS